MTRENKRFAIILFSSAGIFLGIDLAVNHARNTIQNRRLAQVTIGMSEEDATRIIGRKADVVTNDVKEISVMNHVSLFDRLILQETSSSGRTVMIESGRVVSVSILTMILR